MDEVQYTIGWLNENYTVHFERLYKLMYKRLYIFARNYLMAEECADDVVQEVFATLWVKGKTMKPDIPLDRYLSVAVRNLCVDYHRKLNIVDRYQKHLQATEAYSVFPYEEESERESRMRKVIDELPDMQRQVLLLSVEENLKYREVAERLQISEGTVHTHIKRAYKYIKEHLFLLLLLLFRWMS